MANVTLSGYLASAQAVAWTGATQKIDSLVSGEWTDLSDEIDNSANKYRYVDLYLELGSASFTGSGCGVEIYIVPSVDGTNYPDWTGNTTSDAPEQGHYIVCFLPLKATTGARKVVSGAQKIELPNGKFKFGLRSRANVTLAGSSNTLYWRPHTLAI